MKNKLQMGHYPEHTMNRAERRKLAKHKGDTVKAANADMSRCGSFYAVSGRAKPIVKVYRQGQ